MKLRNEGTPHSKSSSSQKPVSEKKATPAARRVGRPKSPSRSEPSTSGVRKLPARAAKSPKRGIPKESSPPKAPSTPTRSRSRSRSRTPTRSTKNVRSKPKTPLPRVLHSTKKESPAKKSIKPKKPVVMIERMNLSGNKTQLKSSLKEEDDNTPSTSRSGKRKLSDSENDKRSKRSSSSSKKSVKIDDSVLNSSRSSTGSKNTAKSWWMCSIM